MTEHQERNHTELVPKIDSNTAQQQECYLPHHPVFKVSSSKHSNIYRSSGRKVTQQKKYHFSGEAIELFFFIIQIFKIEESETANTYIGKKGILYT
jgi:hypothetical protein